MAKKPTEKDNALAEVIARGGYTKPSAEPEPKVSIKPPNMMRVAIGIRGNAPLMINRFSQKALTQMQEKQAAGSEATKGRKREKKDFDEAFVGAMHISRQGWHGISAGAFRNAMISACRLVGFKMTIAKMSVFIEADGYDRDDGTPLVRILSADLGEADMPIKSIMAARNATGVIDLRTRPRWDEWGVILRIRFDGDQFSPTDIVNLLARVGGQCGIGEGRPDSKMSAGIGFGTFDLVQDEVEVSAAA
jgi:hypothetical protein